MKAIKKSGKHTLIKTLQVFEEDQWICKLCNMKNEERKSDYMHPFAWQNMCTCTSICVCGTAETCAHLNICIKSRIS